MNAWRAAHYRAVCRRYSAGEATADLAREYQVGEDTLRRWLRFGGVTMRPKGRARSLSPEQEREVCRLYADGLSSVAIGSRFSVSRRVVVKTLHDGGVPVRSRRFR